MSALTTGAAMREVKKLVYQFVASHTNKELVEAIRRAPRLDLLDQAAIERLKESFKAAGHTWPLQVDPELRELFCPHEPPAPPASKRGAKLK
jgi:hypothetical protein